MAPAPDCLVSSFLLLSLAVRAVRDCVREVFFWTPEGRAALATRPTLPAAFFPSLAYNLVTLLTSQRAARFRCTAWALVARADFLGCSDLDGRANSSALSEAALARVIRVELLFSSFSLVTRRCLFDCPWRWGQLTVRDARYGRHHPCWAPPRLP